MESTVSRPRRACSWLSQFNVRCSNKKKSSFWLFVEMLSYAVTSSIAGSLALSAYGVAAFGPGDCVISIWFLVIR